MVVWTRGGRMEMVREGNIHIHMVHPVIKIGYEGIKGKTDDGKLKSREETTYLPPPSGGRWVAASLGAFDSQNFVRSVRS